MVKVQCLAMAKHFLSSNFSNSMHALAAEHTWRSRFQDQLEGGFKDWLLRKAGEELTKGRKVEDFVGGQ
jgi:hypothetical protein